MLVSEAALIPSAIHTSEVRITRAVIVQTTIVSMKVPVMLTSAWLTGSLVFADAAAIAAEPNPASLENKPLATPKRIAAANEAPINPPVAAVPEKASVIIMPNAAGIFSTFKPNTTSIVAIYIMIINGTKKEANRPTDLTPPMMTIAVKKARTIPVQALGMPNVLLNIVAVALAWTILPAPKVAKTVKMAKKHPNQRFPNP